MEYRWLEPKEIEELVNPVLKSHGWAELNVTACCSGCGAPLPTNRVLGAFLEDGTLFETLTFQMFPMLGPMVKHTEAVDSGEVSRQLAATMYDWLNEAKARDFMAVANSPVVARICERFGMKRIEAPVYARKTGEQT